MRAYIYDNIVYRIVYDVSRLLLHYYYYCPPPNPVCQADRTHVPSVNRDVVIHSDDDDNCVYVCVCVLNSCVSLGRTVKLVVAIVN